MKSPTILPILVLLVVLAALALPCAAYSSAMAGPVPAGRDTTTVSSYFESIRDNPNELRAFFLAMPKGGDLHNHLTGAVYAEDVIDISARHGILVDPATGQLAASSTAPGLVPVSSAYSNTTLYSNLVDDWSMRDYPANTGSGRAWFFKTFGLIGPATNYMGEMIASIRDRAADENVMYIETMMHARGTSTQEREAESKVPWNDNLSLMRENLLDAGLREVCIQNARNTALYDARSQELAGPGGKNVTVRYIYEAIRLNPKKDVYTDLVQAFETANQSSLVAGINLVGEEDTYYARTDYRLHMQMISYLHSVYPDVPIALHAGEQTTGLVPPEDLRFHVADAINTAKASRIGHGIDIMEEDNSSGTLDEMAQQNIPIEILLTSNEQILHVSGAEHPVSVYLGHHVPVVIATDDPGVERTDLSEQYAQLALQHPELSYEQIRDIDLNSIRYSFLPGPEKARMLAVLQENLDRFERSTGAGQQFSGYFFFMSEPVRAGDGIS
jgi:adenosine deaminase